MTHWDVFEVALQLVRALREPVAKLRTRDASLADQLQRAGSSAPLNLAEGARRAGKDRLHHYRISAGSTNEVVAALRVAEAWGFLDAATIATPRALADRLLAMLWRMTH